MLPMSRHMHTRSVGLGVISATVLLLAPSALAAEGGATIASAPHLVWGAAQNGIGGNNVAGTQPPGYGGRTFWRVRVYRGDVIIGRGHLSSTNGCATNRVVLYGPDVNDGNVASAKPVTRSGDIFQGSCASTDFAWAWKAIPVSGVATLWAAISSEAPTFSFVALVRHLTRVSIVTRTRPGTVFARVSSAAGVPSGECIFQWRSAGGAWQGPRRDATRHGICMARRAPVGRHLQVRVRFISSGQWLPSTAMTRAG